MAYSAKAKALRRCQAIRQDGQPCAGWAIWGSFPPRCAPHAYRTRFKVQRRFRNYLQGAKYIPCECAAYAWPHRPGGGLCCWPDPPGYRCTTPEHTHDEPRIRVPRAWKEPRIKDRRFDARR